MTKFLLPALVLTGVALAAVRTPGLDARHAPTLAAAPDTVSFARDILPILEKSCVECHGEVDEDGFPYMEAGLDLRTWAEVMEGSEFGSVVEPGNPGESYLFTMVENGDMPDQGDPLLAEQIELIRRWIEAGAPDN